MAYLITRKVSNGTIDRVLRAPAIAGFVCAIFDSTRSVTGHHIICIYTMHMYIFVYEQSEKTCELRDENGFNAYI